MRAELLQLAANLARDGEPFALAVVVRRLPTSSSREGDMAVVTSDGTFHGWLGGSCTQPLVIEESRRALADGRPRLLALDPDPESARRPGVVVAPMTCQSGGSVEIYIEPILPVPTLLVFGRREGSPVASALDELGQAMGFTVVAHDAAKAVPEKARRHAPLFVVVATAGESDEESLRDALALSPDYLGLVASAKRFAAMRPTLAALGSSEGEIASVRCPAGLDIGAKTPHEIALSILAEIVGRRRALESSSEAAVPETARPEATHAIDPVCGMTVQIAGAKHVAEHGDTTFYFCGGGCRTRFLASPAGFLAAGDAA